MSISRDNMFRTALALEPMERAELVGLLIESLDRNVVKKEFRHSKAPRRDVDVWLSKITVDLCVIQAVTCVLFYAAMKLT